MSHNWRTCDAPICLDDPEPELMDQRAWYPGEPVCGKLPKGHVQRLQSRINRLVDKGDFKHEYDYFTYSTLSHKKNIHHATKGLNPDIPRLTKKVEIKKAAEPVSSLGASHLGRTNGGKRLRMEAKR